MILGTVQSVWFIIIGVVAIAILLKVLSIVHRQAGKYKELEERLKLMETNENAQVATIDQGAEE